MMQSALLSQFPELFHAFLEKGETLSSLNVKKSETDIISPVQVHSGSVTYYDSYQSSLKDTDGIILKGKGWAGIRTADCVPVFLYDPTRKTGGAIHAGWKGLLQNIVGNALKMMKKTGSNSEFIYSVIGPHIRACCYEVPFERILLFEKKGYERDRIAKTKDGKWYLDMEAVVLHQMEKEGISISHIDALSVCTYTNSHFWSFRRDGLSLGVRPVNNILGFY